jgi:ribosomal protein S18 acetylase RimI-like enzyme
MVRTAMEFRDLRWTDFDGWVDLYYGRYEEVLTHPELGVYLMRRKPSLGEEAAHFGTVHRRLLDGSGVAVVADDGRRIAGTCTVMRAGEHAEDAHLGSLGIAVRPEARRQGIGSALLGHALERSRGRFEIVQLSVLDVNETARRLYERHGFQTCGRVPRAFKRDGRYFDELLMWRPIEPPASEREKV